MYQSFYKLDSSPFNVNPNPRCLVLTRCAQEVLACIAYGIQNRKGFVMVTGEVGTGKTTLLNRLLEWLNKQNIATSFVFNSRLNSGEFLDYVLADFGIECKSTMRSQYLLKLNEWLLQRHRMGKTAVLIIDEAQNLSLDVLEEIRLLTNLETSSEKLLQIVLCGQPEFETKMKDPAVRQLRQRITLRCSTKPLSAAETVNYIDQRLKMAGAKQTIFSEEAVLAVHRFSAGIPRVINVICEHALINGFADQLSTIPVATIEAVAREFEFDEVAPVSDSFEHQTAPTATSTRTL